MSTSLPTPLSRRAFVAQATLVALSLPTVLHAQPGRRAGPALRIGVVDLSGDALDPRRMGLALGADEAMHAAGLFGGSLELVALPTGALKSARLTAVVGDHDCAQTLRVATQANAAGIPFLNVGCTADDLRGAHCGRTTFHVAPSDAMYRDALAAAHGKGVPMAWHPSLHRFGAETLNGRFVERFKRPMTTDAWTAWLATKILWESALHIGSADPARLIDYLRRDTTHFDGHKGLPLSFRSWDQQLRQPLCVVADAAVLEVPAANPIKTARALLDQFGTRSSDSTCHIAP